MARALATATHVLISVPPGSTGDRVLGCHRADLAAAPRLAWIGYLSTVGVYGDHGGAWVDETTPATPGTERSRRRLAAEQGWLALGRESGRQVQVFRLAGIYGPGRSAIDSIRDGTARRIVKPGQVFNRIHADDIASALEAAMTGRGRHAIYNVADDEPAPPQDVIAYAAALLAVAPPPASPPWPRASTPSASVSATRASSRISASCCSTPPTARDCAPSSGAAEHIGGAVQARFRAASALLPESHRKLPHASVGGRTGSRRVEADGCRRT